MIKLSRFADYAVVLLTEMARQDDVRLSASDISARTKLPEPTVAKILKVLTREGILVSTRGVNGGYGFARTLEKISLAEIVSAVDGPISLTDCADCTEEHKNCTMEGVCFMYGRWSKVNQAVRTALESVSLMDLIQQDVPA